MASGFLHLTLVHTAIVAVLLCAGPVAASERDILAVSVAGASEQERVRTVVAYSFHGTLRCTTCLQVEQGAETAIRGAFAKDLVGGSLFWRSVNISLPENRHFAAEYQVASWGLVLVEYRGKTPGKWRSLSQAGELVRADPAAFQRYVTAEVRAFLNNAQEMTGEIR